MKVIETMREARERGADDDRQALDEHPRAPLIRRNGRYATMFVIVA